MPKGAAAQIAYVLSNGFCLVSTLKDGARRDARHGTRGALSMRTTKNERQLKKRHVLRGPAQRQNDSANTGKDTGTAQRGKRRLADITKKSEKG